MCAAELVYLSDLIEYVLLASCCAFTFKMSIHRYFFKSIICVYMMCVYVFIISVIIIIITIIIFIII